MNCILLYMFGIISCLIASVQVQGPTWTHIPTRNARDKCGENSNLKFGFLTHSYMQRLFSKLIPSKVKGNKLLRYDFKPQLDLIYHSRYRLLGEIGAGRHSRVWLATDVEYGIHLI